MKTDRLEAFSDGVLAIIITIMVLELNPPHETGPMALLTKAPVFIAYLISFVYLGIYWNNHHHLFQITERVSGGILWANLHLLFWLSLIPFATSWAGENHRETVPVALYGFILLMSAVAFIVLQKAIIKHHGGEFLLGKLLGKNTKGWISIALYITGMFLSFVNVWLAIGCYVLVALIWIIPDKRIEKSLNLSG